jgi:hypothetical protein
MAENKGFMPTNKQSTRQLETKRKEKKKKRNVAEVPDPLLTPHSLSDREIIFAYLLYISFLNQPLDL